MNRALRRIAIASLLMFGLLLVNVNYLQAFQADGLTSKPSNVRAFEQQFQQQRGQIVANDGAVLAKSVATNNKIYKFRRHYPDGPMYSAVTGYDSIFGASGLELAEDKLLSGNDPKLLVRNFVNMITGKKPQGAQVVTTIDPKAQRAAYNALRESGKSGGLVALNPSNGAILAMVSAPTFDPNKYTTFSGTKLNKIDKAYQTAKNQPLLNHAINQTYPPGSTFKVVTSSTLFSSGKYSPQKLVDAPTQLKLPGTNTMLINFDGLPCGNGGKVPIIYAFTVSCNTVFGELGMKIGSPALHAQAGKFGMNDPNLTIPMPVSQSNSPLLTDRAQTAMSAIGQFNDTVTPLQEAMFSSAIANNGTLMKPYLVQKVEAQDLSSVVSTTPQVYSQPVSPGVAGQVKQMMISVTQSSSGTAHAATADLQAKGITVGAKTGTAQNGINNTGLDDAVFTCFAESGNQQIAIGVVVKGGGEGADAAAPIAVAVIDAYLGQQ